jgi:two-component system response regulator AtoC
MPEHQQLRALLAVNDVQVGSALRAFFSARGYLTEFTSPGGSAASVRSFAPHILLLELQSVQQSPLASLQSEFPLLPIVAVVPHCLGIAFHAAKHGAAEILPLPFDPSPAEEDLPHRLGPLLDHLKIACAISKAAPAVHLPALFNSSPYMAAVRNMIDKVAATSATVLIRGESGVGKEIVARQIFARSERVGKPFVKVNCAAIPHDLLESELFGYDAGAFTGAFRSKPGKFELADGGTLFLDEIAEMHPALQAKLLHVLQDGEFARLGSRRDTAVDVRVLCATNKLLEQRVAEGLFREDLFYRINVVTIHIPPLRERRDEISGLLSYFIEKYAAVYGRPAVPVPDEVMKSLLGHSWPGNIRELENLSKRYVIVGDATQIIRELETRDPAIRNPVAQPLSPLVSGGSSTAQPAELIAFPERNRPSLLDIGRRAAWQAERQAIQEMLLETRWNRKEAARRLQVSYKALLNKIRLIIEEDGAQSGGYINHK